MAEGGGAQCETDERTVGVENGAAFTRQRQVAKADCKRRGDFQSISSSASCFDRNESTRCEDGNDDVDRRRSIDGCALLETETKRKRACCDVGARQSAEYLERRTWLKNDATRSWSSSSITEPPPAAANVSGTAPHPRHTRCLPSSDSIGRPDGQPVGECSFSTMSRHCAA